MTLFLLILSIAGWTYGFYQRAEWKRSERMSTRISAELYETLGEWSKALRQLRSYSQHIRSLEAQLRWELDDGDEWKHQP